MKMKFLCVLAVLFTGCYGEFDYPHVPRTDPCTRKNEDKYVYVMPTCRNPPVHPHPRFVSQE